MTRQNINTGTVANDGTGDTLRAAGTKINSNFVELYQALGGDSDALDPSVRFSSNSIVFEGVSLDDWETTLSGGDPTADRTITLPDADGTVILTTATQTLTNKTLTSPVLTTPQINDTSSDHKYVFAVNELAANRTVTLPLLTGNDTFTFNNHTQTLTNKTLTSPIINTPRVGTSINDTNGAELIKFTAIGSAVNEITVINSAASNNPQINATGDDTNITLQLAGKGTGKVRLSTPLAFEPVVETGSGAITLTKGTVIFDNASPLAMTLADGTSTGEIKKLLNRNTGLVTVTPTNFADGTSFSIRQYGFVDVMWDGSNWFLQIDKKYASGDGTYVYVTP